MLRKTAASLGIIAALLVAGCNGTQSTQAAKAEQISIPDVTIPDISLKTLPPNWHPTNFKAAPPALLAKQKPLLC
jgi:hypothetical protein